MPVVEFDAVVLETHVTSTYSDTLGSYEFPRRYLRYFEGATVERPLLAVIYEPRGEDNSGKMAYVGWTWVTNQPVPTGTKTRNGEDLFVALYDGGIRWFPVDARREVNGEPLESWLRARPRGRERNVATFGRAVRAISMSDIFRVFSAAGQDIGALKTADLEIDYPERAEHESPILLVAERARQLVTVLERDAGFRRDVLSAYGHRCAVSGFEVGDDSTYRARRILEAAHIRPVSDQGPDHVTNGIALTPTLHRFFDEGLFTFEHTARGLETRVSPRLDRRMIESPDGRFRLAIEDGLLARLPGAIVMRPDPAQIRYHAQRIFRAS